MLDGFYPPLCTREATWTAQLKIILKGQVVVHLKDKMVFGRPGRLMSVGESNIPPIQPATISQYPSI